MFPLETLHLAEKTVSTLASRGTMIVTAESCTGGLIASALTSVPGSSEAVYGGFVTYANEAKQTMIGVPETLIKEFGAVSEQVARAMAEGALKASEAAISIAVTGIAGPGGGTPQKPVGLVHFGCATTNLTLHREIHFGDIGRDEIRLATVNSALEMVLEVLANQP